MSHSEQEEAFVRAFIIPRKRERMVCLLANPKRRHKVLDELYHFHDLDDRFVVPVPTDQAAPADIARSLRLHGAPSHCWVISTNKTLDAREMPLDEALTAVVGHGEASLLSCITGKLGFFEGEEPENRCILRRDH